MTAEDRLLALFERLRKLALEQNPVEDSQVTAPQLALLDWIAAAPGCGVQEVAGGLGLTAPTVSVRVRRLEEMGLVKRRPDPQDGRAVRLFLTEQGRALQGQAKSFRRTKMRRVLAGLTVEEQGILLTLLERAIAAAETG